MAKTIKPPKPIIYRHSSHAEWGLGMIVEETSSKIYLVFEDGGRRPFLNVQRYRDLLVPAELEATAAEEMVARLSKSTPRPASKPGDKKARKKAVVPDAEEEGAAEAVVEQERDEEEDDDDE
jgi:hypothetical protein